MQITKNKNLHLGKNFTVKYTIWHKKFLWQKHIHSSFSWFQGKMNQSVNGKLTNEILLYINIRMESWSREIIIPIGASLVIPHLELQFCVPPLGGQPGQKGNGEQAEVSKEGGREEWWGIADRSRLMRIKVFLKVWEFPERRTRPISFRMKVVKKKFTLMHPYNSNTSKTVTWYNN